MRLKDAMSNLHQEHPEDTLHPLYTPWGEVLDPEHIWEEYPRPQMKRGNYRMLNGFWDYKIEKLAGGTAPGNPFIPDGQILVPFSPEALLSGVNRQLMPDEYLWYQRTLAFSPEEPAQRDVLNQRCLLHFGAVDQQAQVYVNGRLLASHRGGYLPFTADVTPYVSSAPCLLQVRIRDESDTSHFARGKQTLKRGGMFYTAQSGIWQSVWYEWVPENHILSCRITPDFDHGGADIELLSRKPFNGVRCRVLAPQIADSDEKTAAAPDGLYPFEQIPCPGVSVTIRKGAAEAPESIRKDAAERNGTGENAVTHLRIQFENWEAAAPDSAAPSSGLPFSPWTPDAPWLYPIIIEADEDRVESYFAMRCFSIELCCAGAAQKQGGPAAALDPEETSRKKGSENVRCMRFCLNHSPLFLHGLLDQGYWPDGLMTAPCDEAFLYDIHLAKSTGFNMLRKHIKIEPLRWYYHCDRQGMLVWQDMVSGGTTYHMPMVCYLPTIFPLFGLHLKDNRYRLFSRHSAEGRAQWEQECADTITHLYNVPSLAVWVPFNEGWGQFDAARIAELVKQKDATRPVDHASGWFDQKGGDFRSVHNYFRPLKAEASGDRAFVISEYGGYTCHIDGHSSVDRVYGYQKYASCEDLSKAYRELISGHLLPLEKKGLCGAVYTQLSDVEEEVNGLVTYDRRVVKLL